MTIDRPSELAEFPQPLAEAVVTVLQRRGIAAEVERGGLGDGEAVVVVPAAQRDEAVAAMAANMEEIRRQARPVSGEADGERPPSRSATPEAAVLDDGEEEASRPLVSERLRQLWPLPVLLVPLLVFLGVTQVRADVALMVLIGVMVVVVALRQGRRER